MEGRRFFIMLGVVTIATALVLLAGQMFFPVLMPHAGFSFASVLIFTGFSLFTFWLGKRAVRSANKYRFIQVMIMIIIAKILICLLVILIYLKLVSPEDKLFVIPFILIYLVYTVFEVYYLEKIAKEEPDHDLQGNHK